MRLTTCHMMIDSNLELLLKSDAASNTLLMTSELKRKGPGCLLHAEKAYNYRRESPYVVKSALTRTIKNPEEPPEHV